MVDWMDCVYAIALSVIAVAIAVMCFCFVMKVHDMINEERIERAKRAAHVAELKARMRRKRGS